MSASVATQYDVIVLGTGGMGSSALYHLARRGARVLGLDQYTAPHGLGSSHGDTRIIRQAYFEHPNYVPLLRRAYTLWEELELLAGEPLLHKVGLCLTGAPDSEAIRGTRQAAKEHGLPLESLSVAEARRRFPQFRFAEHFETLFEPSAGYLLVERCVAAYLHQARRLGADVQNETPVRGWNPIPNGIEILTDRATFTARACVVTAGAWAGTMLRDLHVPFHVKRKTLHWYAAQGHAGTGPENATFFYDLPEGQFYGFPSLDGATVKVAEHTGGTTVANPALVDRSSTPSDDAALRRFLNEYLPGLAQPAIRSAVCLYTMSPDGHFVIDHHPTVPQVVFGAGFSGHGFKFASVIGEVLADLALTGCSAQPVGFLGLSRFHT